MVSLYLIYTEAKVTRQGKVNLEFKIHIFFLRRQFISKFIYLFDNIKVVGIYVHLTIVLRIIPTADHHHQSSLWSCLLQADSDPVQSLRQIGKTDRTDRWCDSSKKENSLLLK